MANVGEVEHHRHAEKLVAPLANHGASTRDDGLREMIVQGHLDIAELQGGIAIDDECGHSGNVQQPATRWHKVIAIATANTDVGHLEIHRLLPVEGSMLSLT